MGLSTPLFDTHVAAGARTVDFGGWDMPLHYGSQVEEHHQVRRDCRRVRCLAHDRGGCLPAVAAATYLQHLLANDVERLKTPGKALYSGMLNQEGGVIDDLISTYLTDYGYRVVVNAATRDKDLAWMQAQAAGFAVELSRACRTRHARRAGA